MAQELPRALAPGARDLLRELAPQVLAVLTRRLRDLPAAEDAVQEALLAAARTWPVDGVPANPRGWLVTVAVNRAVDVLRAEASRRRREIEALLREPPPAEVAASDDTLALLLMCCHPSLSPTSAMALTLRAVGGLTTAEIARAFLVPETTMAQRISRAKRTVSQSGATFTLPSPSDLPLRLRQVLHVVYLVFAEGHAASSGTQVVRVDLADEAIRLTRLLHRAQPDDPEISGLLALMLLTDARRAARQDDVGDLVPLPEQDRTLWDAAKVDEGLRLLERAVELRSVGEYQLQALIAAVHHRARAATDTDWHQILGLYGLLEQMTGSPVVRVNRAVATAMVDGPAAGLAVLDSVEGLDAQLGTSHRVLAVRAHLLELAGDTDAALAHYRRAADRATSFPEQRYLQERARRLRRASTT